MPKLSYSEKLKDPRRQKKRLEVMHRDGFKCRRCDATNLTLHIHHLYYVSGREPWEYPAFALGTLCERCHKLEQDEPERLKSWELILRAILGVSVREQEDGLLISAAMCERAMLLGITGHELVKLTTWMLDDPECVEMALQHQEEQTPA